MRLQICSWKAPRKLFTAALHPLWRIWPLQFLRLLSSKAFQSFFKSPKMKEPPHIPLAMLQKLSLESKRKREKIKNQNQNKKKKSQKNPQEFISSYDFLFLQKHTQLSEQTRTPKSKTRKKHKTHTQRDPQSGDALPQRGACRERVNVPEERERERERIFRALEFASK